MPDSSACSTAAPLLARNIGEMLPSEKWMPRGGGAIYPRPQSRIRLIVERNSSLAVLDYEERDPEASEQALGVDFMAAIGDDLSPRNMAALASALIQELTAWQVRLPREDDYTGDLLRALLAEHETRRAARDF